MTAKLYLHNVKLTRAYDDGWYSRFGANPFPAGTPEHDAYAEGAKQDCSIYSGVADCDDAPGVVLPGGGTPAPGGAGGTTGGGAGVPPAPAGGGAGVHPAVPPGGGGTGTP